MVSPPPWLAKHHPESLPVNADGVTYWPGGRQAYCLHSAAYKDYASKLVRQMAERYGKHPALKIWHINNEYGCHTSHGNVHGFSDTQFDVLACTSGFHGRYLKPYQYLMGLKDRLAGPHKKILQRNQPLSLA